MVAIRSSHYIATRAKLLDSQFPIPNQVCFSRSRSYSFIVRPLNTVCYTRRIRQNQDLFYGDRDDLLDQGSHSLPQQRPSAKPPSIAPACMSSLRPNLWVLYHQFRRIEKQTFTPVPRPSSKLIKVVGELRPSATSRVPAESQIPQVPVQLERTSDLCHRSS